MKNLIKSLALLVIMAPSFAFADASVGYTRLNLDDSDSTVSLGALNLSYTFETESRFSIQVGTLLGVADDKVSGIEVELDPSFYIKGMIDLPSNFFATLSYGKYEGTASVPGTYLSLTKGYNDTGFGLGYNFSPNWTASFERVDKNNFLHIRYNF